MRKLLFVLAALFALDLHAAVTGRVFDEDGKPIAKATVRAYPAEPTDTVFARLLSEKPEREPDGVAVTKEDGSFTVETKSLVPMLLVEAPGKAFFREAFVDGSNAVGIVLRGGDPLRGRVTSAGKPVENALVVFGHYVVRRTKADGTYEVPTPWMLADRVYVIHPKYAIAERPLRLPGTGTTGPLDVALEEGVTVRGRVRNAANEPVANAVVKANGWPLGTSLEDGSFTLTHVPAKWIAIGAATADLAGQTAFSRAETHDITLRPAATLTGAARSTKDNAAVPGTTIIVAPELEGMPVRTFIADAKGAFSAGGITPGTYTIRASHPLYRNEGITLPLAEAAKVSRQIAMTPFGRLTGTVVDEQRKPVAGAVVVTANRGLTVTPQDGKFSLLVTPMLVPVPNITVSKPGYAALQSGPHNVPDGETKDITLTLVRGVPVVIKVVDRDAVPVVNEPVFLMHARDEAAGARGSVPCAGLDPRRCRTDAKGSIQFQVPPGRYDIGAGGDSVPVTQLPLQTIDAATGTITIKVDRGVAVDGTVTFSDGSPLTGDVQWVVVVASARASRSLVKEDGTFSIRNAPPGPITLSAMSEWLRVEGPSKEVTAPASGITLTVPKLARIEGKVVDRATRQPVREFNVSTQSQQQGGRPSGKGTQVQAEDGAYVLENVAPGTLDVVVTAPGYVLGTVSNVVVAEGKTVSNVDVQLDRGATIVGRVTAGGTGLADVLVTPSTTPGQRTPPGNRSTRTDANGDYTLQGVAAGERAVDFWKDGYIGERKSVTATAGKEARLDVELSRGRELRGRVTDSAGRPILAARVRPQSSGFGGMAMRTIMTDAEGGFVLQGLSNEQKLTVFVDKDGYLSKTLENVDPNGPALTVTLDSGGSLTGRVVGVPESEMTFVQVVATGGRTRSNARPDPQGNFTIQGLPDGQVTLFAMQHQPRARRTAQQVITVANGTAPSVTLEFGAGVTLRGRVTRGGVPLEVGMLDFRAQPGTPGVTTTIGRGGAYELGMDPGTYHIWVNGPGLGRIEAGEVTVTGSTTHDIELRGTALRGRVVDAATGAAIINATVRLERPVTGPVPFAPRQERTDSNGAFTIDLLADDTYRLRTSAERYASDVQDVVVGGGAASDLLVQLRPGDRIGVRVVDASDGRIVQSSSVSVTDERNAIVYSGVPPRDNDDVMLLWLLPGRYKVRVYSPGYGSGVADISVPGPTVTIPVERAGRVVVQTTQVGLRARLRDATSRVVQGAQIPQGTFENIPAGTYTIEILDARDVIVHRATVNVVAGQTATVVYE